MNFEFRISLNGFFKSISILIHKEESYILYTPYVIQESEWDLEKQRPKNIYLKKHKKLNEKLDNLKIGIANYINKKRSSNKPVTKNQLQKEVEKICNSEQVYSENSLLFFMKDYIERRKELICVSTHKRYIVFLNLMKRFEGYIMKQLYVQDIDSSFVKKFILFGKEELYSENTIHRTIHFVKTILNFIERKGIRTAVKELEIRKEKKKKELISLTESEIRIINTTNVPRELQAAKDWLIISCYTGQRFSDFMNFKKENFFFVRNKMCIKFTQKKTKKEILLPLHPVVLKIIEKNHNSFPALINIIEYNTQIKQIARLANFNEALETNKRIGFRVKKIFTEKWQILTSHIGRRSFATNFYGKIPTPLLMEATGHSTEQIFLKYINPVHDERIISLGNYFERIHTENMKI